MNYLIVFNDGTVVGEVKASTPSEARKKIAKDFSEGHGGPESWKGVDPNEIMRQMENDYEIISKRDLEPVGDSYNGRCPQGYKWVTGYRTKDGWYIQGYCRKNKK